MSDVTQILRRIERGDLRASGELLPLVYNELRNLATSRMRQERSDHTLQATALVHEVYLRLVDQKQVPRWESRGQFFAAAAVAMRRILVESARARLCQKRGGDRQRVELQDFAHSASFASPEQLLQLDEALTKLESDDSAVAALVRVRLYAGLSNTEAAKALGISRSTAFDYWKYALSWFSVELGDAEMSA